MNSWGHYTRQRNSRRLSHRLKTVHYDKMNINGKRTGNNFFVSFLSPDAVIFLSGSRPPEIGLVREVVGGILSVKAVADDPCVFDPEMTAHKDPVDTPVSRDSREAVVGGASRAFSPVRGLPGVDQPGLRGCEQPVDPGSRNVVEISHQDDGPLPVFYAGGDDPCLLRAGHDTHVIQVGDGHPQPHAGAPGDHMRVTDHPGERAVPGLAPVDLRGPGEPGVPSFPYIETFLADEKRRVLAGGVKDPSGGDRKIGGEITIIRLSLFYPA